jgi:hypothetical protein
MEAEGDGFSAFGTQAAMGAEDEEFWIKEAIRIPTHASVLREAEEIP